MVKSFLKLSLYKQTATTKIPGVFIEDEGIKTSDIDHYIEAFNESKNTNYKFKENTDKKRGYKKELITFFQLIMKKENSFLRNDLFFFLFI